MKKLLNTLYITTQETYLHRDGETAVVRKGDEVLIQIPIHTLEGLVCIGRVSVSPPLMGLCAERGVGLSFFTENGRFLARVSGPVAGNVLLRREQYRVADDGPRASRIAQAVVMAKIANSRTVLMRGAREREPRPAELDEASRKLALSLERLLSTGESVDRLRGIEGDCARTYFSVFDKLILANRDDFQFGGRTRRPPLDSVNALLSFVYTLLVHDVSGALEAVGLDPYVGYLHSDRPGRPSLALDLMEELRPVVADRMVLSLINRQQVTGKGFIRTESGAVRMADEVRKDVLLAWQKRKQETVQHPFIGETVPIGLIPFVQAQLLARHLRGDLDAYPAMVWR